MAFGVLSMDSARAARAQAQVFQAWLRYDPGGQIPYERPVYALRLLVERVILKFR